MVRRIGDFVLVTPGRICAKCQRGPIHILRDAHRKRSDVTTINSARQVEILSFVECQACGSQHAQKILYDTFPQATPAS